MTFMSALLRRTIGEEVTGTIEHPNLITEQVSLELAPDVLTDYPVVLLDLNALTQNITIRTYVKVDGTNYRLLTPAVYPTDFPANSKAVPIVLYPASAGWAITLQSAVLEGDVRSIPYRYVKRVSI